MSINPYESPRVESAILQEDSPVDGLAPFLAWEKLRIWYNAILVVVVLLTSLPILLKQLSLVDDLVLSLIPLAVGANVCFCLGLVLEWYLRWFRLWRDPIRIAIFAIGTLIAALAAFLATGSQLFLQLVVPA